MHPEPLASPLEHLRLALPDLPARLREAGRFIARNEFDATTRSMRDLAAVAGLPPACFTRLAQALGHPGWDAFREALIETRRPRPAPPSSDRASGIAATMIAADLDGLASLAPVQITAAAKRLHAARCIWIAGFRECHGVARLLHYQLCLFRPDSVRLVGGSGPEEIDCGAFRHSDAVVVVAFAPYPRSGTRTGRAAREAGCVVIALADAPTVDADHLLLCSAASTPGFFQSLTTAVAAAQALAAATFELGGRAAEVRLGQTKSRFAAPSEYDPDEGLQP